MKKRKVVCIVAMIVLVMGGILMLSGCGAPPSKADGTTTDQVYNEKGDASQEGETTTTEEKGEEKVNNMYISASKLNVREDATQDAPIVDSLMKGTAVEVLEEKTNDQNDLWYKVKFHMTSTEGEGTGWVLATYTVKDRMELLDESLRNLDFSPQDKVYEYPDNPRKEARGVYVTIYSASNSRIDELIEMAKRTKINAFVIDVKDDNGTMLFKTKAAEKFSPDANKKAPVKDIQALMKKLKDNDIYAIARIVSFKDPTYAKHHPERAIVYRDSGKPFTNRDGLIWVSAHDRELWEYNIEVSKEAVEAGFNEIQFDYVRFPASNGGKLDKLLDYRNTTGESKPETIQNYLKYAREQLASKQAYISADIYGLVGSVADDMALGQYWEAVSNVVDYVSPMMYPSHYANGTYGLSVPDAYPYETIYQGTKDAIARNKNIQTPATIRPWIQDFTAPWVKGHIKYGPKQLEDQIRALEENGVTEYLLWNAGNRYSEEAVKK
ncbi:putative glycoside hydrolase [Clostridiaceae bacterium 35-E11]